MDWLSQNWIWLAIGISAIFVMSRGGGCCGSHAGDDPTKKEKPGPGEGNVPHHHA
jgi:hypothetical protein